MEIKKLEQEHEDVIDKIKTAWRSPTLIGLDKVRASKSCASITISYMKAILEWGRDDKNFKTMQKWGENIISTEQLIELYFDSLNK